MADYNPELESLVRELNQKASSGGQDGAQEDTVSAPQPVESLPPEATESLDRILKHAVHRGASDVLFVAGSGIVLRLGGHLERSPEPVLNGRSNS